MTELEAARIELRDKWAARFGLTRSEGRCCVKRLLGKRCDYSRSDDFDCMEMGYDHPSLWNRDGKPVVFLFQPYQLGHDDILGLAEMARKHQFYLSVATRPAWHYPGSVLHIEIWASKEYYCLTTPHSEP